MVSRGGGALHLEAVCLSDWVFASSGPHACLSFLDPHHEHDHDNDVDAVDKQALFAWLGRTLVSVNSKRVWQDLHAAGGSHRIASQLVARLWQALSLLAQTVQAHAHESRTRGRVEDTEQTALVLIECLHFLCTSCVSRFDDSDVWCGVVCVCWVWKFPRLTRLLDGLQHSRHIVESTRPRPSQRVHRW